MKITNIFKLLFSYLLPSREHLSDPNNFIIPKLDKHFFIRLGLMILIAWFFFGVIAVPAYVKGASMEPTYARIGFNFCWRPAFWFSSPKRGDVIIIRYSEKKLYLKRVIGLPGDSIEFKNGKLYLNDEEYNEPYVKKKSDWNLPVRVVPKGKIYVIGDNRSMAIEQHKFGAVYARRIYGAPLW